MSITNCSLQLGIPKTIIQNVLQKGSSSILTKYRLNLKLNLLIDLNKWNLLQCLRKLMMIQICLRIFLSDDATLKVF
jgi:hypothetical protein